MRGYGDHDPAEHGATNGLRVAAERSLNQAQSRPGRDREAAHALLAADAFLTLACAEAAEADDPDAVLLSISGKMGDGGG
ncbi:MAG: hypothetical protein EA422_07020 [Gemmatimonadales bacterium]|nr:MAG: hypothetical protein EA422_07020 [Gemmatimonadales bacterium]